MLKSLHIRNLLSFGPEAEPIELRPLNVLIGPNGSGKSNLIEVIGLLRAAPENLSAPVKESGGVREWLHLPPDGKGTNGIEASIEAVIEHPTSRDALRHRMQFGEEGGRFEVTGEVVENEMARGGT